MQVNDLRGKTVELGFDDLEASKVYVSHRLQKYVLSTDSGYIVCVESGEMWDGDECQGDVFTEVNAVLQIS